jgi:hypothetical protein
MSEREPSNEIGDDFATDDRPKQPRDGPADYSKQNGHAAEPPPDIDDPAYHAAQEGEPTADADPVTEGTVADAFAARYRDVLRYCHDAGAWYLWDGSRWRKEKTKIHRGEGPSRRRARCHHH